VAVVLGEDLEVAADLIAEIGGVGRFVAGACRCREAIVRDTEHARARFAQLLVGVEAREIFGASEGRVVNE
jgi:hypothetical protein